MRRGCCSESRLHYTKWISHVVLEITSSTLRWTFLYREGATQYWSKRAFCRGELLIGQLLAPGLALNFIYTLHQRNEWHICHIWLHHLPCPSQEEWISARKISFLSRLVTLIPVAIPYMAVCTIDRSFSSVRALAAGYECSLNPDLYSWRQLGAICLRKSPITARSRLRGGVRLTAITRSRLMSASGKRTRENCRTNWLK